MCSWELFVCAFMLVLDPHLLMANALGDLNAFFIFWWTCLFNKTAAIKLCASPCEFCVSEINWNLRAKITHPPTWRLPAQPFKIFSPTIHQHSRKYLMYEFKVVVCWLKEERVYQHQVYLQMLRRFSMTWKL